MVDNWFCKRAKQNFSTEISSDDICSHYVFADKFMCKVTENQLKFNQDRGTPLVCNNKVVGLLSVIIPPGNGTNSTNGCDSSLQTMAYYTRVGAFVDWVYATIGNSLPPSNNGQPNPLVPVAPPFHDAAPATHKPNPSKGAAESVFPMFATLLSSIIVWMLIR